MSALGFASFSFFLLSGFGAQHSTVDASSSMQGKELALKFVVKPDAGMKITKEGPWSLTLNNPQGLKFELKEGKFETKELNESLPGFEVKAEVLPGITQGKVDYTVKAFVCSEDKKHCYPQVLKGSLDWSIKS